MEILKQYYTDLIEMREGLCFCTERFVEVILRMIREAEKFDPKCEEVTVLQVMHEQVRVSSKENAMLSDALDSFVADIERNGFDMQKTYAFAEYLRGVREGLIGHLSSKIIQSSFKCLKRLLIGDIGKSFDDAICAYVEAYHREIICLLHVYHHLRGYCEECCGDGLDDDDAIELYE